MTIYTAHDFLKVLLEEKHPKLKMIKYYFGNDVPSKIQVQDEFGVCEISVNKLMRGISTGIRTAINKNTYFRAQSQRIHKFKYNYLKVNWISNHDKVSIICNKCKNTFEVTPTKHLQGQGCSCYNN